MLNMGATEESHSDWSIPVVLVLKADELSSSGTLEKFRKAVSKLLLTQCLIC